MMLCRWYILLLLLAILIITVHVDGKGKGKDKDKDKDKDKGKDKGKSNNTTTTNNDKIEVASWNTQNVTDCRTEISVDGECLDVDTSVTAEHVLNENLFSSYDKNVRPVFNFSKPVYISFGMKLSKIVRMDNVEQLLFTSVWITQKWHNPYLTWDSELYGGMEEIHISPDDIWVPDIVLYNNFEDEYAMAGHVEKFRTNVIVDHQGNNTWLIPTSFRSSCKLDVAFFPFDSQVCNMTFGSWTFNAKQIIIEPLVENNFISELYSDNGNWDLVVIKVSKKSRLYSCCKTPFSDVTFHVYLQRKPMYYVMYLLLPAVIISSLNLLIFVIPVETGERLGLCITVLLTMSVFLLLVQENLPDSSEKVPLVGIFCIVSMVINAMTLVCAVIVMNCYHSSKEPWRILRVLFVKRPKVRPLIVTEAAERSKTIMKMMAFTEEIRRDDGENVDEIIKNNKKETRNPRKKTPQLGRFPSNEELKEKWMKEWEQIGAGLDRVFFWFFVVVLVASSLAVYMNAPIITKYDNLS